MSVTASARDSKVKQQVMPLAFLKRGESGIVSAVNLGDDVRKKLISLGICPNSELTVSSESCGSVIVCVGSAHYALSRSTAMKILVGISGKDNLTVKSSENATPDTGSTFVMPNIGTVNEISDVKRVVGTI